MRRPPTPANEYDEEEAPRRRARPADEEEPKTVRRRSRASDEEEDEEEDLKGIVSTGWGGAKQLKAEMPSDFAQQFTIPDGDPVIIKFIQDEPFANFRQHWAEWLPKGSKLSYVCPKKGCPLCAAGDKPAARFCFNIVDFTDPDNPINSVLAVGFRLSNVLEKLAQDKRTGPLAREDLYFAINKTGSGGNKRGGGNVQTNITPVKERDLEQDWDIVPLTEADMAEFEEKSYTAEDYVTRTSMATLKEVADQIPE